MLQLQVDKPGIYSEQQANSQPSQAFASLCKITITRMNSTIIYGHKNAYHTIVDAEFTGVYERIVDNFTTVFLGSVSNDYHFFIKFGNKV